MARDRGITTTQTWDDYQRGLDYLRRRNYFDDMDKANRFYVGDQWYGLQAGAETPPMFNFIKPTVKYKASVVSQNDLEIVYNPMDVTARNGSCMTQHAMRSTSSRRRPGSG